MENLLQGAGLDPFLGDLGGDFEVTGTSRTQAAVASTLQGDLSIDGANFNVYGQGGLGSLTENVPTDSITNYQVS